MKVIEFDPSPVSLLCEFKILNDLLILLGVIFVMWLLEPIIYKVLLNHESTDPTWKNIFNAKTLIMFYKYIGLGLIFLVGLMLWLTV